MKVIPVEPPIAASTSPVCMKLVMIQVAHKFFYRIGPLSMVPSEIFGHISKVSREVMPSTLPSMIGLKEISTKRDFIKSQHMVYYNPPITGEYNPLYKPNNQGPLFHCSNEEKKLPR